MKIRTAKYIFKEGILNTYKNKLMSLASIGIVAASLVLFGIFLLIVVNLDYNAKTMEQLPQMQAYCDVELDDTQIAQVESALKENSRISEVKIVTKKEAFEKLKQLYDGDPSILEGYDESFLPISFIIKMKDPADSVLVKEEVEKLEGVDSVECPQKMLELISKLAYWIKFISGILIAVLLIVSIFIISNTIKLTVFARRKEINIMKYIGATDWFIRWPFIVEGVIIGILGAGITFLLTCYSYNAIEIRFNDELLNVSLGFIKLISFNKVGYILILFYIFLGGVVGSAGSFISLRKHLRV